ncbi:MAG: hypothetical protein HYX41_07115 [Bdellovibrio sp.]|nr:hypothetical protein [Bdellovibrio sp.]
MGRNVVLSNSRDVPLLHFLWKWKVSSTAAIIRKFFPNIKGKSGYARILILRNAGIIRVHSDGHGKKFVCSLDRKGFEAIRETLPPMREDGFKSEQIGHDLLVSAFHLGEWLLEKPETATLFSEQQLRRMHPDMYPDWVPRSEVHRPDGYTQTLLGDHLATIAFEVELSNKRDSDYLKVAEFYEHYEKIERVLWLVPRQSTAIKIQEKMNQVLHGVPSPHNFILLEDFANSGWHAEIKFGSDKGKTLISLLSGKAMEKYWKTPSSSLTHALLDTRKSPYTSDSYRLEL